MSILYILLGILALVAILLIGLIIATIQLARRPSGGPTTTYNVVVPPVLSPVEGPAYPPAHRPGPPALRQGLDRLNPAAQDIAWVGSGRVGPPATNSQVAEILHYVPASLLHITGPDARIVRVRPKPRIIGEPDDEDIFTSLPVPPAERANVWIDHDHVPDPQIPADPWDDAPPARRPDPPENSHVEPADADHARADRVGPGRVAQAEACPEAPPEHRPELVEGLVEGQRRRDPPELVEAAGTLSLRQLRIQHGIGYTRAKRLKETYDPTFKEDL